MTDNKKKVQRIKPDSPQWRDKANALARQYCPPIYACKHCSHPVVEGYCCGTCGSSDPGR